MFFILSKTLNYLTMPLVIVCLLLLASAITRSKRWKPRFFRIGLLLLLFFTNDFIANEVLKRWEIPATPIASINRKYDLAIILTGVTKSNMKPDDRVYFQRGADRVTHTVQLYKLGIVKKILVSGGDGNLIERGRKEADEISDALQLMGVPREDILIENQSKNTNESASAVAAMLEKSYRPDQCLLITSAFHMRRSLACFKKVGWAMDTYSTDFITHERKFTPDTLIIPRIDGLIMWNTLIKEWTGMFAYKLAGYI